MNTIDKQVDEALAEFGVTFKTALVGETKRDEWRCDEWRVKLGNFETAFFTGTGHRKPIKWAPKKEFINPRCIDAEAWGKRYLHPVAPSAAGVLHALLLDSKAVNQCFDAWCGDFEYSNDSMKALKTYQECCKIGAALRKVFTTEQRKILSDLLEDY